MPIKTSLVQTVVTERKERLIARARASLGITTREPDPVSEPLSRYPQLTDTKVLSMLASSAGIKRAAPNEHVEPSDLGSKDVRKSKSKFSCHKSKSRSRSISMSSLVRGDKRVDSEPELALHQLEMQRRDIKDHQSRLRARTGKEKTSPNPRISSPRSVMKTRFGEDSLRLYNACLLPVDQIELASMPHCTLEEIAAHDLMRVAAVTHQLTLRCTKWRNEMEEKVKQLSREKERVETEVRVQHEQRLHALERQFAELRAWSEEAEWALLKSKLEIERLEQHSRDSFNAGRAAGRLEMATSEEHRAAIRQATLLGIKEYLRSPTFELILAAKAAEHEVIGFTRCRSQALELDGFKEGFEVGLLDSAKGGNLEPAAAEADVDVVKYMINK